MKIGTIGFFILFYFLSNLKWKMEHFIFSLTLLEVLQYYICFRIVHRI